MFPKLSTTVAFGVFSLAAVGVLHAEQQANSPEMKLREALRNMALQLRSAESERDTLKVTQTQLENDKKTLSADLDNLKKESGDYKASATKQISDLTAKVNSQAAEIAKLKETSASWEGAYNKQVEATKAKEGDRAKLASDIIELQRKLDDRETKNIALFKLGKEILNRYEKFGLGTAITAREPFVGVTRVKLQSLVQDYQDKLADQRVKP
jgi:chromosome segregation ATPase